MPEFTTRHDTGPPPARRPRPGFSLIEVQVAFVILGIGLAGICPIVAIQLRLSRKIEQGYADAGTGLRPFDAAHPDDTTFSFVPDDSPWVRKAGAAASVLSGTALQSRRLELRPDPSYQVKATDYTVTLDAPPVYSEGALVLTLKREKVASGPTPGGTSP